VADEDVQRGPRQESDRESVRRKPKSENGLEYREHQAEFPAGTK
jgi:hypothetical protein